MTVPANNSAVPNGLAPARGALPESQPGRGPRLGVPRDRGVHQLFEAQVERAPDAVALVFGDQILTYRELNDRADRVAEQLRALGVGPDVRVGICLRRSLDLVAGLLAILKAGGAYVPMDPAYPGERLVFMLKDAGVAVLLTESRLRQDFQFPISNFQLVCVDDVRVEADRQLAIGNWQSPQPHNLAYVIYTSGSTGTPKGVMVEHRNVVNFFTGMDAVLGPDPGIWLAVTSISFDISVLELFWTLTRGFKVIIHDGGQRSIAGEILRHNVTHFQCTPSQAAMLAEDPANLAALRGLKKILLGGEALPPLLVERLLGAPASSGPGITEAGGTPGLPGCGLFNMYGPTETTVWSAAAKLSRGEPVTIGRPIANTDIYIVDDRLQPVAPGDAGELLIGGAGVARGYLNRPELTAEKFLDWSADSHVRESQDETRGQSGPRSVYRTGDLARFRPDGTLEFLGRADHQVKLRGHRIELGEIETVLAQHPAVRRAVVVAREDQPGDQRLVAYVVPQTGPDWVVTPPQLRQHLKQKLPDIMIPSAFVLLDALPLTPNGKIDRKALPKPAGTPVVSTAFVAAGSDTEKTLAAIWRDLLQVERVGMNDNFFDLGGHSVLIAQVHSRVQEQFKVEFSITRLFECPTVGSLAKFLSEGDRNGSLNGVQSRAQQQRAALSQNQFRRASLSSSSSFSSSKNGARKIEDENEDEDEKTLNA